MAHNTTREKLLALWGIGWVALLLGRAIWRLTPLALEPWFSGQMSTPQQALYLIWVAFNAYAEGYRGFQLKFCPRVVMRAAAIGKQPTPLKILLALPYCMSLFRDTRRQMLVSWTFTVAIVALVIVVRVLPQPWRGIVDGGVVIGLLWGMIALGWFTLRYLRTGATPSPSDPSELRNSKAYASQPSASIIH